MDFFTGILTIIILTLVNAFFASAEIAVISLDKRKITSMADEGNKKAQMISEILKKPESFFATVQVGVTLAGFLSSAFAASVLSENIMNMLIRAGISLNRQGIIIGITILLSYFVLVFGELFPKRIAVQHNEKLSFLFITCIAVISRLFIPSVNILSFSVESVMKITGNKKPAEEEQVTEKEIQLLLRRGLKQGTIEKGEEQMIRKIFRFNDIQAKEVMIVKEKVYSVDENTTVENFIRKLPAMTYSRIPVYRKEKNNIVGICLAKNILKKSMEKDFADMKIGKLMDKPIFVSENILTDDLFHIMKKNKKHIAVLTDNKKHMTGIITIEDLIEVVMGEIEDEFD